MRLTEQDYADIVRTQKFIDHVRDDAPRTNLTLIHYMEIAAFILVTAKDLFFHPNGKPKSWMQLLGNIGAIIRFITQLVRMVNGKSGKK
jgi:hypothetical protein